MVLQIEAPPALACALFERSSNRQNKLLCDRFRCVVVRPLLEDRAARSLQTSIAHPTAAQNCIAVWEPLCLRDLKERVVEKDCYLAGPAHWVGTCEDELPPAVQAFDDVCCAVLAQHADREALLDLVFGTHARRPLEDLFDAITDLRKAGERMVVLWDDPDYEPPGALPV